MSLSVILVGAGGHARTVAGSVRALGWSIAAYCDRQPADWLPVPTLDEAALDAAARGGSAMVMGIGGATPERLERRHDLFRRLYEAGARFPAIVDPAAVDRGAAPPGDGSLACCGVLIQPGSRIGRAVIVNTGAIVEHDAIIGDGAHLAPGSIVLGGASVGARAMVGAGAVVLPGAAVPPGALVPAQTRYPPSR